MVGKTLNPTGAARTLKTSSAPLTVDLDLAGIQKEMVIGVPSPIIKWTVWMQTKRVVCAVAEFNQQQQPHLLRLFLRLRPQQ